MSEKKEEKKHRSRSTSRERGEKDKEKGEKSKSKKGLSSSRSSSRTSTSGSPAVVIPEDQYGDPFVDRVITPSVCPTPAFKTLSKSALWDASGLPILANLKTHFLAEGRLASDDALAIFSRVTQILRSEPNMVTVKSPITIAGDTHGQFYDLVRLFEVGGDPASTNYLFLGDYVDRGNFSFETLVYCFCCKIRFPTTFFMLRGNHECRHLTEYFTFESECLHKYNEEIYEAALKSFEALPLAALLNDQFLCVHGGISPEIDTLDDILAIDRFREPPSAGPMCDLLWADPIEEFVKPAATSSTDQIPYSQMFKYNEVRGCSYLFTYQAVCDFLERNDLLSLIRAHEAQDAGYRMHLTNDATGFPSVITLFSAPNYLGAYNNKGAVLRYENDVMNIRQFNDSKTPYYLPNFMSVFTWSFPFVMEKVAELLLAVLNVPDTVEPKEVDPAEAERRRVIVRNKIRAVTKMRMAMALLRTERETIMEIKSLCPGGRLPPGLLAQGSDALKAALGDFKKAKLADKPNELRPDVDQAELRSQAEAILMSPRRSLSERSTLHHSGGGRRNTTAPSIDASVTVDKS